MAKWLLIVIFSVLGFLSGSVLYGYILPKLVQKKNIYSEGEDGNPGVANVFMKSGVLLGIVCLVLELLKGFVPVFVARCFVDIDMWFVFVAVAPVVGHALGIFNHLKGGKCITVSFGVLLGVLPFTYACFVLLAIYIVFAGIIQIKPNRIMSIITYCCFIVLSATYLIILGKYNFMIICIIISLIVILKHLKHFENK